MHLAGYKFSAWVTLWKTNTQQQWLLWGHQTIGRHKTDPLSAVCLTYLNLSHNPETQSLASSDAAIVMDRYLL